MNSTKSILTLVFMNILMIGYSQNIAITGHISDMQGNKLFAVNVYLLNKPTIGTTADLDGNFVLYIPKTGSLKNDYLVFSFVGYNQVRLPLDSIDYSKQLLITLHEDNQTIKEVVFEGRKSISKEFSIKELDKMKIYLSPLASADPLKALAMLPASTNTDETANPELRGSDANRTKVFLNGVPVSNPVRNSQINGIGFFSLFNPEIIKNELVYPSNPPLIYGNTSAGIIDIETEDKMESNNCQISSSLASSGINISQKIDDKSFYQIYGNLMYSDGYLYVNPIINKNLKNFYSKDIGLNYHNELSENLSFNFYNYLVSESSNVLINLYTWQDYSKSNTVRDFSIVNLKYQKENNHLSFNFGTNFSNSHYSFGNIKSINKQKQVYLSFNYKHVFPGNFSLQTGVSNENGKYDYNNDSPTVYYAMSPNSPTYHSDTTISSNLPEAYLYLRWNPFHKIIWGVGVRKNVEFLPKKNPSFISLQTNVRYNLKKYQSLIFSIGQYNNIEEPNYYQKDLRLLSAKQYSLEYLYEKKNTTVNLAAYYKNETGDVDGTKRIKGVEIYLERDLFRKFKASISNSILNSELSFQDKVYNSDNNVGYFLVTTLSYSNPKFINISASWSNRQGKFYTPVVASNYNPSVNFYEPVYSNDINSNRFGNYNTLNLSANKMITIQKSYIIVFASVFNLLNTSNQRSLNYNKDYSISTFDYYQKRAVYFGCVLALK